ncbi:YadA C-terminal domain-containing protein, partial [Vibrio sinaloensis]
LDTLDQSIASTDQQAQTTLNDVHKLQATQNTQQQSITANQHASAHNQQLITANTDSIAQQDKAIQRNQQKTQALDTVQQQHSQSIANNTQQVKTNAQNIAATGQIASANSQAISQQQSVMRNEDQQIAQNHRAIEQEQRDVATNSAAIAKNRNDIYELRQDMENMAKNIDGAYAESAAFAGLVDPYGVGNIAVTAALGYHGDAEAIAVGIGDRFNEHLTGKLGGAYDTATESMSAYVGIGYEF